MQHALVALRARPYTRRRGAAAGRDASRGVDSFESHYYLARAYAGLDAGARRRPSTKRRCAKLPGDVESVARARREPRRMGDERGASRAFEKLVSLAPRDPVARMQLGEAYRDVASLPGCDQRVISDGVAIDPKPAQYLELAGNGAGRGRKDGGRGAGVRGSDDARAGQRPLRLQPRPRAPAARPPRRGPRATKTRGGSRLSAARSKLRRSVARRSTSSELLASRGVDRVIRVIRESVA